MLHVPLIKDLICYVCGKGVDEKDSVHIGHGLRRHLKCRPGSRKWTKHYGESRDEAEVRR